jgi:hypothetical protein
MAWAKIIRLFYSLFPTFITYDMNLDFYFF